MSMKSFEKQTSEVFAILSNPFRIQIALALFGQEACVCHLEQMLKKRQAFISQHLMVMRDAGLLDTRREGKYIYYRLSDKESILDLIRQAAKIAGLDPQKYLRCQFSRPYLNAPAPNVRQTSTLSRCRNPYSMREPV